jgi:hypothetical protein
VVVVVVVVEARRAGARRPPKKEEGVDTKDDEEAVARLASTHDEPQGVRPPLRVIALRITQLRSPPCLIHMLLAPVSCLCTLG